ncbi:MAG TPA: long-chain fatty acid--CoA ligase [Polyangiaceae bacterium]|nr:long-chain fatty acid--CoA ligase [Polyangiaceae bacterium]
MLPEHPLEQSPERLRDTPPLLAGSLCPGGSGDGARDPESLLDAFEAHVRQHPERTLFLTKSGARWHELDYARFAAQVDAVRAGLHRLGVAAGDRVGIISKNCVAWAAIAYAGYGLSAALVPMYENQLTRDWEYILRDSGARLLFVSNEAVRSQIEGLRAGLPALEHVIVLEANGPDAPGVEAAPTSYAALLAAGEASPWPALCPTPDTPAAFLYTSGTTGDPKGVVLTHGNIWSNVSALKQVALGDEQPEQHRTLAFLPWAHAFAHTVELHLVIAVGASMGIAESIEKVADNLREVQPTVLMAVPRVFIRIHAGVQRLMNERPKLVRWIFWRGIALARERAAGRTLAPSERSLLLLADRLVFSKIRARFGGRLKFAISGAALLPREVASFVAALGITVCEGYGLTETSPIVSANVPGSSRAGSVGRPLPNVRVVIEPTAAADAPSGEIVVYGPNVMAGYHHRERETREAFSADGGFRTGDLGYLDADGYLFITGRIKEQYKLSNGKYVVPSLLEAALERSPFVAESMVAGDGQPCNVALIVPDREALSQWATRHGLAHLDGEALRHEASVRALLQGEIDAANREQKSYERVRAFRLLARSFGEEEGLLTPSMKLRRYKVAERFHAELDAMFVEAAAAQPFSERERGLL